VWTYQYIGRGSLSLRSQILRRYQQTWVEQFESSTGGHITCGGMEEGWEDEDDVDMMADGDSGAEDTEYDKKSVPMSRADPITRREIVQSVEKSGHPREWIGGNT
jgi:hypothetical protein